MYILDTASLRAQYGTEMPFNAVHGSWDSEDAHRELALLFPGFQFSDQIPESAPLGKSSRQIWSVFNPQWGWCVCVCVCVYVCMYVWFEEAGLVTDSNYVVTTFRKNRAP